MGDDGEGRLTGGEIQFKTEVESEERIRNEMNISLARLVSRHTSGHSVIDQCQRIF